MLNATSGPSRPSSPLRLSSFSAASPPAEPVPRPPSRCESLLRDTLRRADEYERTARNLNGSSSNNRSASRSPGRFSQQRRSRGNSFLGFHSNANAPNSPQDEFYYHPANVPRSPFANVLNDDDVDTNDDDDDARLFAPNGRGSFNFLIRAPSTSSSSAQSHPPPVPPLNQHYHSSQPIPRVVSGSSNNYIGSDISAMGIGLTTSSGNNSASGHRDVNHSHHNTHNALNYNDASSALSPSSPPHFFYGSPSSPSPLPPTMLRTRTAPAVPRASRPSLYNSPGIEDDLGLQFQKHQQQHLQRRTSNGGNSNNITMATRSPTSPPRARSSQPNTANVSNANGYTSPNGPHQQQYHQNQYHQHHARQQQHQHNSANSSSTSSPNSNDSSSPKMKAHPLPLSPHEAVLRAKLESVLSRAGPPASSAGVDDRWSTGAGASEKDHQYFNANSRSTRTRNHQRSQSHGVNVGPTSKMQVQHQYSAPVVPGTQQRDDFASVSPKSLATSSLSNSVSDMRKMGSGGVPTSTSNTVTATTPQNQRMVSSTYSPNSPRHMRSHSHSHPITMHKQGQGPGSSSPSSPSEPLTPSPPSTPPSSHLSLQNQNQPSSTHSTHSTHSAHSTSSSTSLPSSQHQPFNAQMASEMCKKMNGYVSFASVEGLGLPPGVDVDDESSSAAGEGGGRGHGEGAARWMIRWLKAWPFGVGVGGNGEGIDGEHDVGDGSLGKESEIASVGSGRATVTPVPREASITSA